MQWETHTRECFLAWTVVAGLTVPEKSGSKDIPGDGRRVGQQLTVTQSLGTDQRVGLCEKPGDC